MKQALADGHCCVIGLQSTGEARAKGAALAVGFDDKTGGQFEEFVCAPNEDLKRIIMMMFPLPPKPKGVIAPVFFSPDKGNKEASEENSVAEAPLGRRRSMRNAQRKLAAVAVDDDDTDDDDDYENDGDEDPDDESEDEDASVSARGKRKTKRSASVATKKQKTASGSSSTRKKQIPWNEIPLDLDVTSSVTNKRLVNYRKAVEMLNRYMEAVDKLELPPNPLDK